MDLITCRGCGEPVVAQSSRCWRCGHPVIEALTPEPKGLGIVAQLAVIASVFAVVLFGMVVVTQRDQAVDAWASASARAVAAAEEDAADAERRAAEAAERAGRTQTPVPAPDAGGPGTYTAQPTFRCSGTSAAVPRHRTRCRGERSGPPGRGRWSPRRPRISVYTGAGADWLSLCQPI